jgi:hypothetical protein
MQRHPHSTATNFAGHITCAWVLASLRSCHTYDSVGRCRGLGSLLGGARRNPSQRPVGTLASKKANATAGPAGQAEDR